LWLVNLKGRDYLEEEVNTRTDLKEIGWGGVDWMYLTQDMDQWWTLVNTVMKLQVP